MRLKSLPPIEKLQTIIDEKRKLIAFVEVVRDTYAGKPEDSADCIGRLILRDTHANRRSYKGPFANVNDGRNYAYFVPLAFGRDLQDGFICDDLDDAEAFWISDEPIEGDKGDTDETFAKQYLKLWNAYASGEVYSYCVKVFHLKLDEDAEIIEDEAYYSSKHVPLIDESCSGYYNTDDNAYLLSEINSVLSVGSI